MMTDDPTRRELLHWSLRAGTGWMAAVAGGGAAAHDAPKAVSPPARADEIFSVRRFGAAGDGKADDTAAAQAAINAAMNARSGRVHFSAGVYRIARTLSVASAERLDITGDGWSTTLLHENDEPLLLWPEGVSCRECSVRHLRVQSVKTPKSPHTAVIACRGGVERSLFQHLLFFGEGDTPLGSGIVTERVADTTTLDQCLMWGVSGVGLKVARGSEIRVFGGRIIGSGSLRPVNIGIHLVGNNGGVHVVTTDLIGLHTGMKIGEAGSASNREIFLTHPTFDSSVHGLVQSDDAYTSIAGCWAASCDEEQILLDAGARNAILSVSGGTIFNGGAYNRPGAHNGLVVRAGRFSLSGVSIRHNKGVGILLDGDSVRDWVITGCRIHNNGTGAAIRGRNGVVSGNVFTENGTDLREAEEDRSTRQKTANVFG